MTNFIGWKVIEKGNYKVNDLPNLSDEELILVGKICIEFSEFAKDESNICGKRAKEIISLILKRNLNKNKVRVDEEQKKYLEKYVFQATFGYGPLTDILEDDSLEEIAIIGLNKPIYVFIREKGWLDTNVMFTERENLIDIINKMARKIGRRITLQNPRLNAILPDGSRMHASIEPVSELEVTIRKFRHKPVDIKDLIKIGYTYEALAFLWTVFQNDKNVIICGNTAAGKTTTLNALFSFIDFNERIILLEETPEIQIPHSHVIKMKTNSNIEIGMKELIEDSLRMRPDRVIIGEVRTKEEMRAMIESMNAGQARGCYVTMHANNTKELISRMRYNEIIPSDILSIDLIVIQKRFLQFNGNGQKGSEVRKIFEICELTEHNNSIQIRPIFKLEPKTGKVVRTNSKSKIIEEVAYSNGIEEKVIEKEIERKIKYLKEIIKSENLIDEIQNYK
jgi:archaeal flagellar protein FlaI